MVVAAAAAAGTVASAHRMATIFVARELYHEGFALPRRSFVRFRITGTAAEAADTAARGVATVVSPVDSPGFTVRSSAVCRADYDLRQSFGALRLQVAEAAVAAAARHASTSRRANALAARPAASATTMPAAAVVAKAVAKAAAAVVVATVGEAAAAAAVAAIGVLAIELRNLIEFRTFSLQSQALR